MLLSTPSNKTFTPRSPMACQGHQCLPASGQIQQWILVFISLSIAAASDTVKPSLHKTLFPLVSGPHILFLFSQYVSSLPPLLGSLLPDPCVLGYPTTQSQPFCLLYVISSSPKASKAAYILLTSKFYFQTQHVFY